MNATLTKNPMMLADFKPLMAIALHGDSSKLRDGSKLESPHTIEEIHVRAETVTPFLEKILNFRPSPHWGINE